MSEMREVELMKVEMRKEEVMVVKLSINTATASGEKFVCGHTDASHSAEHSPARERVNREKRGRVPHWSLDTSVSPKQRQRRELESAWVNVRSVRREGGESRAVRARVSAWMPTRVSGQDAWLWRADEAACSSCIHQWGRHPLFSCCKQHPSHFSVSYNHVS